MQLATSAKKHFFVILGSRSSPWDPAKRIPKNAGNDYWVSFKLNYSRDLNTRHQTYLMLCISTIFRVLYASESWSNYFFQSFSTLFVHFEPCSVISRQKSTKNIWKWTKTWYLSTLQSCKKLLIKKSTKKDKFEVTPQGADQLLHVDQLWEVDKYNFFCSFSDVFFYFRREVTEKGLKLTKKVWI